MPAKVYQYGSPLKTFVTGEAEKQIRLQARFWNDLVEIEHEFSQRYRDVMNNADEKISSLNEEVGRRREEIEALRGEIKERRKKARSGRVDDSEIKKKVAELLAENKHLIQELKDYRAEVKIMVKPRLHELESERRARVKELRQQYAAEGLYWGNYNAVLTSYQTARSRSMQSGGELHFRRFDGTGRLTCQIQGGMSVEEAFSGANNLFQIDPVPETAWNIPSRGESRKLCRTKAKIRITSDEEKNPVWIEIPIVMHRPIPQNARIQRVSISTKKVADRIRWFLNVTVIEDELEKEDFAIGQVVALDVGWRKKEDGSIRIAYWIDSNGDTGEVELDVSFIHTDQRIRTLQKKRDDNFNVAKEKLSKWVSARKEHEEVPEWFTERTDTLAQWRAQARLAALILFWRDNRFSGDGEVFSFLESWRRQDRHLWIWQANLRDKMSGRRLQQYRVFAAKAAKQYDAVIFEEFDLRSIKKKKRPEQGVDSDSSLRNFMKIAGVSILRSEVRRAFEAAGKLFVKEQTSGQGACPFCGETAEREPGVGMFVSCTGCGKVYDRDWAKAKDLLSRWFVATKKL